MVLVWGRQVVPGRFVVGEFPDHEDDEMNGDEEVRRSQPGRNDGPDLWYTNGEETGDIWNGELCEDEQRNSGDNNENYFDNQ